MFPYSAAAMATIMKSVDVTMKDNMTLTRSRDTALCLAQLSLQYTRGAVKAYTHNAMGNSTPTLCCSAVSVQAVDAGTVELDLQRNHTVGYGPTAA